MNKLVIDAGNTKIKAGVFVDDSLQEIFTFGKAEIADFTSIIKKYSITHSILCVVGKQNNDIEDCLKEQTQFYLLDYRMPLPFVNNYQTPQTLGMDRIAAIAGALSFFNNKNCLIIDAGTCVTYDFITDENKYLGGAISPGLQMRLNAMHHYTQKLPQIIFKQIETFVGNTTESSLLSGAFYGLVNEINETIYRYDERYGDLQVITCGGDSILFDKHIKRNIFAAPYLVLYGLNKILSFNVK